MDAALPKTSVAEHLADTVVALDAGKLPAAVRRTCEDLLVDVAGLCVTVREADYIKASLAGWEDDGPCTAIGHARTMTAAGAAFVNGTAAHGEDFDDTFEGGPVHAGAVIVPAVLAACERHNPDGRAALARHRGRRRDHVPAFAGGADEGAQGRLPSDRDLRRHGRGGRRRRGAGPEQEADRRRARRRRLDGVGHHRISRRGRLDQAHACRLVGAVRHARGAAGARRLLRPAHGVRGRARPVPRLRQHARRQLRRGDRRFRQALGHRDDRLQALSLRDHGASLYRLRAAARGEGEGVRHQGDGLRRGRGDRAPAVGAARRQAEARQRLCRKILDALLHRRRLRARQCRAWAISPTTRCAIRRWSRWRRRSDSASIRKIPIRARSPAISARRSTTAA